MGKKSMSGRKLTFLLITIPIVALFFCFNTLPLIKGVIYSFTNFKGYGSYDWVGLRNYNPGTWTEQQDPFQECTAWSLFYS